MEIVVALVAAVLVVGMVIVGMLALGGLLHWTRLREHGYFTYFFYVALFTYGALMLSAGRDFSALAGDLNNATVARNPLVSVIQKISSILLVLSAGERIVSYLVSKRRTTHTPVGLLLAYILFWLGTVASPSFLGAIPLFQHDFLYTLLFGIAAVCMSAEDARTATLRARNALLLFILAGWILLVVSPNSAADLNYIQGYIPGMPRFAGLAAHAVSLGMLAQIALLCLWAQPYPTPWFNRLCWVMGIATLVLAQSKTAWLSFVICAAVMSWVRLGPNPLFKLTHPQHKATASAVLVGAMLLLLGIGYLVAFSSAGHKLDAFLGSSEGAQLMSLTGRDRIWAVAWQEWARYPLFGYGPTLFSPEHRAAVGIGAATHAHNQFMDSLARAGSVGALALVLYGSTLLVVAVRCARASGGLSLALFAALALRAVSEIPLSLFGYGPEFVPHLLLLIVVTGHLRPREEKRQAAATPHSVASPAAQPLTQPR